MLCHRTINSLEKITLGCFSQTLKINFDLNLWLISLLHLMDYTELTFTKHHYSKEVTGVEKSSRK